MTTEKHEKAAPPPIITPTAKPPETDPERDWEVLDAQEKVKQLRGLFATRIFVQPIGEHLRISFGDRVSDETIWHTSIVVPNGEALEYGELLVRMATSAIENQIAFYRQVIGAQGETGEAADNG